MWIIYQITMSNQDRVGIVFPKKRKQLIADYGEYLGSEIHRIITSSRVFDRRLNIPLKKYYSFRITTDNGKSWLMIG